jgi:UDP-N-acetylglucosamine 2-epimerase
MTENIESTSNKSSLANKLRDIMVAKYADIKTVNISKVDVKNASFIIGNSSTGIREASYFVTPCVNLGTRQKNRTINKSIIHINFNISKILNTIKNIHNLKK